MYSQWQMATISILALVRTMEASLPLTQASETSSYVSLRINTQDATFVPFLIDFGQLNTTDHYLPQTMETDAPPYYEDARLYGYTTRLTSRFYVPNVPQTWGVLSLWSSPTDFCYNIYNNSITIGSVCNFQLYWLHPPVIPTKTIPADQLYTLIQNNSYTLVDAKALPDALFNVTIYAHDLDYDDVTPWFMQIVYIIFLFFWVHWCKSVIQIVVQDITDPNNSSASISIWRKIPEINRNIGIIINLLLIALSSSVMSLDRGHPFLMGDEMESIYGFETTEKILYVWCLGIQPFIGLTSIFALTYGIQYSEYGIQLQQQTHVNWIYIPFTNQHFFCRSLIVWLLVGFVGVLGTVVVLHFILNTDSYVIVYGSILSVGTILLMATHQKWIHLMGRYKQSLMVFDKEFMLLTNWSVNQIIILALGASFQITNEDGITTSFRNKIGTFFGSILMMMTGRDYILSVHLLWNKRRLWIPLMTVVYAMGAFMTTTFMIAPYFASLADLHTSMNIIAVAAGHSMTFFVFGTLWANTRLFKQ